MTIHLSFSGGMDSTALLHRAVHQQGPQHVRALSFDYGQTHNGSELEAARQIADLLGVERRVIDLRGMLSGSALLGSGAVPDGHYSHETMSATVVNGRNLLFASAIIAQTSPGDEVWLGVHAGDHPVYADCRPEFVHGLDLAADAYGVRVEAPWVHLSKADIIDAEPGAPFDLSWSCYKGGDVHCGRCGTCVERAEAFSLSTSPDPTTYADTNYWREAVG